MEIDLERIMRSLVEDELVIKLLRCLNFEDQHRNIHQTEKDIMSAARCSDRFFN